jgi:hypothetical protein
MEVSARRRRPSGLLAAALVFVLLTSFPYPLEARRALHGTYVVSWGEQQDYTSRSARHGCSACSGSLMFRFRICTCVPAGEGAALVASLANASRRELRDGGGRRLLQRSAPPPPAPVNGPPIGPNLKYGPPPPAM